MATKDSASLTYYVVYKTMLDIVLSSSVDQDYGYQVCKYNT